MELEKRPMFSVIVPVYQVEKYLRQCVDSILAQSFSDFELILVDDGSLDNCGYICDDYARKDSRVKVIHQENGGVVRARRAGYGCAAGAYIAHVDADDYIAPDLLEMAAEQIQTHQVDAVLFGFARFDEHTATYHPPRMDAGLYAGEKMQQIRESLLLGADSGTAVYSSLWSLIMRRDAFSVHLEAVPERLYRGEDLAAVIPATAQCRSVYVLGKSPYFYRITPGSITNTRREDELEQALLLADYLAEKMGTSFDTKLNSYVLKECFTYLSYYRSNWQVYRNQVRKIRTDRLIKRLRSAKCGEKAIFAERVAFFLLRHQLFGVLWLIWKIKG